MKIWTEAYRPWIMGGNVHAPVICDVKVDGPFDLGQGYEGYLAVSPNGKTFVAESKTGAIIGPTVQQVRDDIETADKRVMVTQIEEAQKRVKRADVVSITQFWQLLRAI